MEGLEAHAEQDLCNQYECLCSAAREQLPRRPPVVRDSHPKQYWGSDQANCKGEHMLADCPLPLVLCAACSISSFLCQMHWCSWLLSSISFADSRIWPSSPSTWISFSEHFDCLRWLVLFDSRKGSGHISIRTF